MSAWTLERLVSDMSDCGWTPEDEAVAKGLSDELATLRAKAARADKAVRLFRGLLRYADMRRMESSMDGIQLHRSACIFLGEVWKEENPDAI